MPNGSGLLITIGSGVGGAVIMLGLFNHLRTRIRDVEKDTTNADLCDERHERIDERLDTVDAIHETVIRIEERMKSRGCGS